jgi:LemA protein
MEWIILVLVLLVVGWLMIVYNRLVALRQACGQAWSDVDVQLKQRHDLIPNLVETVKGYASHEKETLERVIAARNAAVSARTPEEASVAEGQLAGMLRQVFALSEAYPELKANQNFLLLQAELSDIENKIAAARRFFNSAVAEFNSAIQQIPAVFFAGSLGFTPRAFFELPEEQRAAVQNAPQVKF